MARGWIMYLVTVLAVQSLAFWFWVGLFFVFWFLVLFYIGHLELATARPSWSPSIPALHKQDFTKLKSCCSHSPAGAGWNAGDSVQGGEGGGRRARGTKEVIIHMISELSALCSLAMSSGSAQEHDVSSSLYMSSFFLPERGKRHSATDCKDFWGVAWHF